MRAVDIKGLSLPSEKIFRTVKKAASLMVEGGFAIYILKELWEDGHSTWQHPVTTKPVIVTPTGQIQKSHES
jgi:hypothetical protein